MNDPVLEITAVVNELVIGQGQHTVLEIGNGDGTVLEVIKSDSEAVLEINETSVEILTVGIAGPPGPSFSRVTNDVMTGAIDGSNATFETLFTFVPESVEVFINGLFQKRVADFNTNGDRTILLAASPQAGERVLANYLRSY